jgi:hypothetical protein
MATAYYASRISPNQFETPTEGYRICRSVRICRTGYQDYLGTELKKYPAMIRPGTSKTIGLTKSSVGSTR